MSLLTNVRLATSIRIVNIMVPLKCKGINMQTDRLLKTLSEHLQKTDANLYKVGQATGIAYNTLRAIKRGDGNPTIDTLRKLELHLFGGA